MAYPTWLLFLRDETRFEEFLSDVYIPFDCVFMVAQRDRQGSEIIQDVYRIGKEDYLRSMTFGTWNSSHGFQGPLLGLYQRRHDLHGHNIRVVAINVSRNVKRICHTFIAYREIFTSKLYIINVSSFIDRQMLKISLFIFSSHRLIFTMFFFLSVGRTLLSHGFPAIRLANHSESLDFSAKLFNYCKKG